jgi:two-component system response regulator
MGNKCILVVEDNPDDLELAKIALRASGVGSRPLLARDGQEALDILLDAERREDGDYPAMVLLDLKLPRLDGFGVLRRLRQEARTRHLPVVVMSTSREERDVVECYRLGANSYIQKPLDFERFLDAIHRVERYWLHLNEPPRQEWDVRP